MSAAPSTPITAAIAAATAPAFRQQEAEDTVFSALATAALATREEAAARAADENVEGADEDDDDNMNKNRNRGAVNRDVANRDASPSSSSSSSSSSTSAEAEAAAAAVIASSAAAASADNNNNNNTAGPRASSSSSTSSSYSSFSHRRPTPSMFDRIQEHGLKLSAEAFAPPAAAVAAVAGGGTGSDQGQGQGQDRDQQSPVHAIAVAAVKRGCYYYGGEREDEGGYLLAYVKAAKVAGWLVGLPGVREMDG
ncbi:hypothetical protein SLS58_006080 [Diplodia intermedia]|uniref:Uncharacterized protein n=1 Tax=Diplodia intermedia TaxID=856260 RepID=A0ABR3TP31_9PEZI